MGYSVTGYSVICYTYRMPLFSTRSESECLLVFDVGSGSVGGAIVLASPASTPSVLYSFRSDIPVQAEVTKRGLLSHMVRSLAEVVSAVITEGFHAAGFGTSHPKISEVFVSLSAPWVLSQTSFLSLHSMKPEVITQAVFNALLEHSRLKTDPLGPKMRGGVEIEQMLIKTSLNGYETSTPFGKEATEALFAVFASFSLPRVTEQISDTITRVIHSKHISFHSFSLLAFAVLRELFPREESFLIVDVSGEQTEVSVVKKRVLVETVTFPMAKNHLLRALGSDASIPTSGAAALVKLHVKDGGIGPLTKQVARILEAQKKKWAAKLSGALSHFSAEIFLPQRVFLTADDDVAFLFADAIRVENGGELAMHASSFDVVVLQNEILGGIVRWSPSHTPDSFLSLIASVANRLHR